MGDPDRLPCAAARSGVGQPSRFFRPGRPCRRSHMSAPLDLDVIWNFAIALAIGALIGVEREKRKSEEQGGVGGLRTFILLALVGAVAGFLSRGGGVPWLVPAALLPVSGLLFAGYCADRARRAGRPRPHHRDRRGGGLPARRDDHARPARAGDRPRRRDRGGARLQAAPARPGGEARLGRRLCRRAAADRELHRPAAVAGPDPGPVGRAQPLQALAAGDPDLEPLAGRLRRDALARRGPRHGAHRHHRRAGVVDRGDPVVRAPRP